MSDSIETARELATHAADIRHLQDDMDKIVESMAAMQKSLAEINTTLSEAKGGWKVLMMFGGAGGVLGALFTQIIHSVPWPK
jgi:cation transport ATPase